MKHRLHQNRDYPTVTVLRDLASQENCDGEPYDQMIEAADEIERLSHEPSRRPPALELVVNVRQPLTDV